MAPLAAALVVFVAVAFVVPANCCRFYHCAPAFYTHASTHIYICKLLLINLFEAQRIYILVQHD